ncbi:hypothetical protein K503DRAFT_870423, partial [Rhizopogon vinicolor AM-OR11-026]
MEKLQEIWAPSSITTLFRRCSKTDINFSFPLRSPVAGFSWCLIMSPVPLKRPGFLNRPSKCHLFFSSSDCPIAWHGAPVKVTVTFPSHPDSHVGDFSITLGGDMCRLTTRCIDDLGDALISLEVAFIDLPTPNLFGRLGGVDLVPDALVIASAEEASTPQARAALRTLGKSLKTGKSFDIIFQAYTCRLSPGKVTIPSPVYANTTVLQETALLPDF